MGTKDREDAPLLPNETTIWAMEDARAGRVTRVGSVAELFAELNADDTPEAHEGPPMTDPKSLESWLHKTAGPAHDALKADPTRAVAPDQVRHTLDELLAQCDPSAELTAQEREWLDAPAVGRELLPEDLQTAEAIAAFLAHAEATADPAYVQHAREVAARARAMHGIK